MTQRATGGSVSAGYSASRYLERITKALPGTRNWMSRGLQDRWPDGAKLVISISLHFEAGAQIARETGAFPQSRAENRYPLVAGTSSYDYGYKEGIPRLLDVFQRRRVRTTCHMVGAAVDHGPELAKEIVERGHEAAAHGQTWAAQYQITPEEERAFCEANIQSIQRATGVRPIGFHGLCRACPGRTLETLQELGFVYYVDDASRDEPFVVSVSGKPFSVVPHNPELSDLSLYELRAYSTEQYMGELKNEFEMLYTEAESRRRMMSITLHDRIAGRPARAKVLEEFIIYAQRRPGVVFMRKDEIARFALASSLTPTEEARLRASADAA
jgi:peptidoglycan/xylan/chitin deacetylase (PgdA/CDA1 family)